jgi:hypothetical protein
LVEAEVVKFGEQSADAVDFPTCNPIEIAHEVLWQALHTESPRQEGKQNRKSLAVFSLQTRWPHRGLQTLAATEMQTAEAELEELGVGGEVAGAAAEAECGTAPDMQI